MKTMKGCTAALALCAFATQAWAGDACLRPQDANALKTAALQQELMVAALTCNDITLYNHFVVSYRGELQQSDQALQAYFVRADGRGGIADYHAYKTRMANQSSLDSLHNQDYCTNAKMAFDGALEGEKTTLADVVAAQPVSGTDDFIPCEEGTATAQNVTGGSSRIPLVRTAYRRN